MSAIEKMILKEISTIGKVLPMKIRKPVCTTSPIKILSSDSTVATSLIRTNTEFLSRIDSIPVTGLKKEHEEIYEMIKKHMYNLLSKTKGNINLTKEIRFAECPSETAIMGMNREGVLTINTKFFDNIDKNINQYINKLKEQGAIIEGKDGKYKIIDSLRNKNSALFEKKLNDYQQHKSFMNIEEKFGFYESNLIYYKDLLHQYKNRPDIMIENILNSPLYSDILSKKGLLKSLSDVKKMSITEQQKYFEEIRKHVSLPSNTVLIRRPDSTVFHEHGHLQHYENLDEYDFNSLKDIFYWQKHTEFQDAAARVCQHAQIKPTEFTADVYSGLVNGQTFHPRVIEFYEIFSGPNVKP